MSIGLGFLYAVLKNKQPLSFLQHFNLIADDFNDDEKPILTFIQQHIFNYSTLPSLPTVEVECDITFPDFPDEPIEYWSEALTQRSLNIKIKNDLTNIQNALLNDGIDRATLLLRDAYIRASARKKDKVIVPLAELSDEVMQEHERCRHGILHFSIPTGFPFLDDQTSGFQRGDFISIVARVSMGKTYVLLRMALTAHNAGKSVLLVSTEMSPVQYARRLLALKFGVSINRIRLGQLSTVLGEKTLKKGIEELYNGSVPFKVMKSSLTTTLEDVIIQAKEMQPDFICVDGAYLLKSSSTKNQNRFEIVSNSP
jgi:replicative DNA helicase